VSRQCQADKAVFRQREEELRPNQRRAHLAASDTYFELSPSKPRRTALTAARGKSNACSHCSGIRGKPMRVYIVVAALTLSVVGRSSATVVDKGTDIQRSCELLVQDSFHDYGEARSAGSCEGMIETAMLFSPNLPADVRACPPAQGSTLQSAKVLLRYLENNPDRLNEPGITIAIEAFRDAWPCRGDDSESSAGTRPKKRAPKKPKQ
jgi:Rap1a immunity proteins